MATNSINSWPMLNALAAAQAKQTFIANYTDVNQSQVFYTDLEVSWTDFKNKLTEVNTDVQSAIIIPWTDLAVRFIHMYDGMSNRWYLAAQLCVIGAEAIPTVEPQIYNQYTLTNMELYFNINPDNTVGDFQLGELEGTPTAAYNTTYFLNVEYQQQPLQVGYNTQSIVMAWSELEKLYEDNRTQARTDTTKFTMVFSSGSHLAQSTESLVDYPHCVMAYMRYDGVDCLDNSGYVIGNYCQRAANFNTLCPARCDTYLYPIGYFPGRPLNPAGGTP